MDNYRRFEKWTDKEFGKALPPEQTAALAFNLFIDEDENYVGIELIGTEEYDPDDEEWLITEIWGNRQPAFRMKGYDLPDDWRTVRDDVCEMITKYLNEGKYADILKSKEAVVTGYADGDDDQEGIFDIITVYKKNG